METPDYRNLRIATREQLEAYHAQYGDMLAFIAAIHGLDYAPRALTKEHVVYHAWLPGWVEVDAPVAEAVRAAAADASAAGAVQMSWPADWQHASGMDLDALTRKTLTDFPAIQNPVELRQFLELVEARRPKVVVEIGTAAGGVLYCMSQLADPEALLISIDVPHAPEAEAFDHRALMSGFGPRSQRFVFLHESSLHHGTRQDLEQALDGRPIDLLFIDGDHSYGGVSSDYRMYGPLVAEDGIIAFHDICMYPETWGRGNEVGIFWDELAPTRRTRTIIDPEGKKSAPRFDTPVGFEMPALGFGVILPGEATRR